MGINILGITSLLFAIVNIILGVYVLLKDPRKSNNVVYSLSVISIALWIVFTYLYNNPGSSSPKFWLKMVYIASYGMLLAQLLFAYFFPKRTKSKFYPFVIPIVLALIPSIYVLLIKDSVIDSVIHYPDTFLTIAKMGPDYWIYTLPNLLGIILIPIYYLNKSKTFTGYEKVQSRFFMIGVLAMMLPIVIIDYFIPILTGNTKYFILGPLFVIPFTLAAAYPIIQNRFVRIPVIVGNVVVAVLKLAFIFSTFLFFTVFLESEYYLNSDKYLSIFLFALLFTVFYFYFFKKITDLLLDFIDKARREREILESNFLQVSGVELTMDRILVNLQRSVKALFSISESGILLYDKVSFSEKYFSYPQSVDFAMKDLMDIVQFWGKARLGNVIVADEFRKGNILQDSEMPENITQVLDFMDKHNISVLYPFNTRTRFNGLLILGYREDGYPLALDEIEILERMVDNTSVSMGRAILYDEIQEFSGTLKQRVDEQTKELQQKVLELEEARRKERDMIDIMGHELRTPATIAKLNIDLLEQYIDTNPKEYKKYLDRVKNSIENEIRLINALLTSAKLEGEKIELHRERISLKEIIENVIHAYTYEAESKKLKVIQDVDEDMPDIFADKVRVTEIMDNLLNNAIKYTKEGSVIIQTSHTADHVQVNVIDSGMGIPDEEIPKLGTKFHRVGNYIKGKDKFEIVRPGGTGLGLYVVFALVEQMGGKIWVKSDLGKGTTFSFTLPVYTGQKEDIIDTKTKDMYKKFGLKKS